MYTNVWTGIILMLFGISGVYFSVLLYKKIGKIDYKDKPALEKLDLISTGGILASGLILIFIGILFTFKNS
ncbi:MAG TPA: hypothetical protein VHO03_15755 [Ignavibacteriales bacterium]|nr:hypothetical protein [Ignavibacteriales bacterium]